MLLGQRCERAGRPEAAIALYRAALEQDNLAEELYQHLIACHLARGDSAQALNAYRRCRELLSIVLGLKPSARTEAGGRPPTMAALQCAVAKKQPQALFTRGAGIEPVARVKP